MRDRHTIDQATIVLAQRRTCSALMALMCAASSTFLTVTCAGFESEVEVDRGRVEEPNLCTRCQEKETMELVLNRCGYCNKQIIRMQVGCESGTPSLGGRGVRERGS